MITSAFTITFTLSTLEFPFGAIAAVVPSILAMLLFALYVRKKGRSKTNGP